MLSSAQIDGFIHVPEVFSREEAVAQPIFSAECKPA